MTLMSGKKAMTKVSQPMKTYLPHIVPRSNLSHGYSRQDLNLSYLCGQKYAWQNKAEEVHGTIIRWEEQSKEMIISFLHMFYTWHWHQAGEDVNAEGR
jgi:hypothetical protein